MLELKDLQLSIEHSHSALKRAVRNLRKFQRGKKLEFPKSFVDHPIVDLEDWLLDEARVFANRQSLLRNLKMQPGAAACEVGTSTGVFAREIALALKPRILHVLDIDFSRFNDALLSELPIVKHEGKSTMSLDSFEDGYFDFVYVDADHSYKSVREELAIISRKAKPGAIVMFNDYTNWSIDEVQPYGVIAAVNEFALERKCKVIGIALSGTGHHDIALSIPA